MKRITNMDFVRVNQKLADEDNNLTVLPIKILQPVRDTYDVLLVQPSGIMQATDLRIGHADQIFAIKLYKDLLTQACEHAVDLLVTPEYCVPWSVVEDIGITDLKPKSTALWALGCESITPVELDTFKAKSEQNGIKVVYEKTISAVIACLNTRTSKH